VEADADTVTVTRASNTLVLQGKVAGAYRLQPAGQEPTNYPFRGDRAIIRYVPEAQATASAAAGFQVELLGNPATREQSVVEAPAFSLF
jgi:hypothetical protein